MNLNQLRYVIAVMNENSFSKASDHCNVSQPTMSNGIAALEEEFGGKLFNRTTRKTEITVFGQQILPLIEAVLHAQRELLGGVQSYHKPEHKMIRVGFSPLVDARLIKNCVESFFTHKNMVDLFYKECLLDDLGERLLDQTIDLMVRPKNPKSLNTENLQAGTLHSEAIVYLPRVNADAPSTNNAPVTLEDIRSEFFILTNGGCGLSDFVTNLFSDAGYELNVYAGEAISYQVLSEWSELGIGAAILPESRLNEEATSRAKPIVDSVGEPITIEYCAYWLSGSTYPEHVNTLHDYLRESAPKYLEGLNLL